MSLLYRAAAGLVSALALAAVLASPPPTAAQDVAVAEAKPDADLAPRAAPDPLTPPKEEPNPAAAPGAPAPAASTEARKSATEPDAIVAEVRRAFAEPAIASALDKATARADRAAVEAHYAEGDGRAVWTSPAGLTKTGEAALAEMAKAADYGLDAKTFAHLKSLKTSGTPAELAETEIRIALAVLTYARHARGGRVNPAQISAIIDREAQLYGPRSLLAAIAASDEADIYLRQLHPRHAQFQKLQQALVALRAGGEQAMALGLKGVSAADAEQRILINMERWRWLPDDMGELHIWNNVPEQMTRVIHGGKAVLTEKIVVGKPTQQTPEFSAPMRYVIFHPSWGVPDGIKTNEIGPMLKRAAARNDGMGWLFGDSEGAAAKALKRHDLKVMHNGREINPDTVNWNAVDVRRFQFTQPPSAKNVLGVVKFRFPNRFDVYMHDTSDRHLFAHPQRAYSHGCMRVENPMRMAETILAYDKGWPAERVAAFVPRGQTADVTLAKQVNVHITYFTTTVDDGGKLRFFSDLYGRDARVASALAGKPVAMASVATPAAVSGSGSQAGGSAAHASASATRSTDAAKHKAAQRIKSARDQGGSGGGFNPFGWLSSN